jgi:N-acetylmuramoyl-L-alanine amidase
MVRHLIIVAALLAATPALGAPTARAMFDDATQQEQAVRRSLSNAAASPAVLKSVRHAIASYEAVVRRYPTSGYSDDALWSAGKLALDAYNRFGNAQDRETAVRLLRWLSAEYPTSKLAKRAPGLLATADHGKDGGTRKAQGPAARTSGAKEAESAKPSPTGSGPNGPRSTPAATTASDSKHPGQGAAKTASLTGVQRVLLPDVVRITIAFDAEVSFHDEQVAGPSRIFFDFPATAAKASLVDRTFRFDQDGDAVRQFRVDRQSGSSTRVVLDAAGVSSYSVYPLYNPYRLVIDLVRTARSPRSSALSASLEGRPGAGRGSLLGKPLSPANPARSPVDSPVVPARAAADVKPAGTSPLAGTRIAGGATGALPAASPAAATILEAARTPSSLESRAVGATLMRRPPSGSPRETAAILEATRVPPTLGSRMSAPVLSRGLPNTASAHAALIADAVRPPDPLASRTASPPLGRGLPNTSPIRTAAITEALHGPSTLTGRSATTPVARGLPSATAVNGATIADARRALPPLPGYLVPSQFVSGLPNVAPAAAALIAEAIAPASATSPTASNLGYSMARQLGLGVSRVVIDPGHGGHDPGAKGKGGVTESELVLDVSLRVEKLLEKVPGLEVVLTRHTDDFVALAERTAIANREGADLFLSIHANASPNDQAQGVETYFLNFANNLTAAAVAARENTTSGQAMGALPDFVRAIALNNKVDESRDFATRVQQSMVEGLRSTNKGVKNLGVKQAPFVVLIGASMPSVLAEISFVTNEQEAKLLKSSAYRQKIAEALVEAVQEYQGSLKRVQTIAHQ